jgi:hypothetical protein
MEHADLYHGEAKKSKAKKKKATVSAIDISALPEALRKKYIDGVISAKEQQDENALTYRLPPELGLRMRPPRNAWISATRNIPIV